MFKFKKYFPYAVFVSFSFGILVLQMSLYGPGTSASDLDLDQQKVTSYEQSFEAFQFKTTKGNKIVLNQVKQPIVILNFWASWCRPCIAEFKSLKKMIDHFGREQVLVVGINNDHDEPEKAVLKTEKKLKLNFDSIIDKQGVITDMFNVSEIPTSFIFDRGKIIMFHNKEFDFMDKEFIDFIQKRILED